MNRDSYQLSKYRLEKAKEDLKTAINNYYYNFPRLFLSV